MSICLFVNKTPSTFILNFATFKLFSLFSLNHFCMYWEIFHIKCFLLSEIHWKSIKQHTQLWYILNLGIFSSNIFQLIGNYLVSSLLDILDHAKLASFLPLNSYRASYPRNVPYEGWNYEDKRWTCFPSSGTFPPISDAKCFPTKCRFVPFESKSEKAISLKNFKIFKVAPFGKHPFWWQWHRRRRQRPGGWSLWWSREGWGRGEGWQWNLYWSDHRGNYLQLYLNTRILLVTLTTI